MVVAARRIPSGDAAKNLDYLEGWFMYSYDDRLRAVRLYIKLGKRVGLTIRQLGYAALCADEKPPLKPSAGHPLKLGSLASQPYRRTARLLVFMRSSQLR